MIRSNRPWLIGMCHTLLVVAISLVACSNAESVDTGSSGLTPGPLSDLAATITTEASEQNWLAIKQYVTPEFAELPDDASISGMQAVIWQSSTTPEQWLVRDTSVSFSIAELIEKPEVGLVFKRIDDKWYFDPGPEAMFQAYASIDEATVNGETLESEVVTRVNGEESEDADITERPIFTRLDDGQFVYATEVSARADGLVGIDFNEVQWIINGQAEPVTLLWTTWVENPEPRVFGYPGPIGTWRDVLLIGTSRTIAEGTEMTLRFGGITVGEGEHEDTVTHTVTIERTFEASDVRIPE